uniref:DUF569 domain-containing protein n=1 Tax=Oryza punctata TaxID=4537 RepID=A0A0E0LHM7_ORYPU
MEVFQGVEFAVLRVWHSASYLYADEDGRSVDHGSLRGGSGAGSVHNAVWAVEELVAGAPPTRYVLLRGAYGRYLGAGPPDARDLERCACCSLEAVQRDRDEHEVDAIMWRAIGCSGPDDARGVILMHDWSGRYLRGNNSFLARRRGVSVDGNVDDETTLRWEVVPVPRPELPIAAVSSSSFPLTFSSCDSSICSATVLHFVQSDSPCSPLLQREIQFVTSDEAGKFVFSSFRFTGRSVQLLRAEFVRRVNCQFTMCVRAGRHGRLTPLLINLPHSRETLHIVLVRPNITADEHQLLSSILNAEDEAAMVAAVELQHQEEKLREREEALRVRKEAVLRHREERLRGREEAVKVREEMELQHWEDRMKKREDTITLRELRVKDMEIANLQHRETNDQRNKLSTPLLNRAANKEDTIWDKRQTIYMISLGVSVGLLVTVLPFIPRPYIQIFLAAFVILWGLGSAGFPMGLFGTTCCEKGFSRHSARIIFMAFSLMVIFVVYALAISVSTSPSSPVAPPSPADYGYSTLSAGWTYTYIGVGALGCVYGGDGDPDVSSSIKEHLISEELLERLLKSQAERH